MLGFEISDKIVIEKVTLNNNLYNLSKYSQVLPLDSEA